MLSVIENHRSVRSYRPDPIPEKILEEILLAGTRAANTGNMQLYSMVVTTDAELKQALLPCHFGQKMVVEAPVIITFCADIRRFSQWCRLRGAEPRYDNFLWFVNSAIDTILVAANVTVQAEAYGLGTCCLGTTPYTSDRISEVLRLPDGVIPVTTYVMGYPAGESCLTDRLPLEAVVHRETYRDYTPQDIDRLWFEKEASELTASLIEQNGLPNLARIFTDRRYPAADNLLFSAKYFEELQKKGFFNK